MKIQQWLGGIALVIPLIAGLYASLAYMTKLQNTLEQNTIAIQSLAGQISGNDSGIHQKLDNEIEKSKIELESLKGLYTQGRENMVLEMTEFAKRIAQIEATVRTLQDGTYKLASEAELRALEQTYYTLRDSVSQLTFDMKELARKLDGGY